MMSILKFDTRKARNLRRIKRILGRSLYLSTEAPHFQVRVNDDWYIFCAIHKNASSSIRSLVERASSEKRRKDESIFEFLFRNHLVRGEEELDRAKHIAVFLRSPIDRVVSCFQNKFIHRNGNRTIFEDFSIVARKKPADATFEDFVLAYLRQSFKGAVVDKARDRHIYTQCQQLLPIDYDVVARVDQFDEIIGRMGLAQFSAPKANSTSNCTFISGAWAKTAEELHMRYRERNEVPSKESLLTDALKYEINRYYREDMTALAPFMGDSS